MTDLEMTKLCAKAMGYEILPTVIKNYCRVRIQYPSSHHDVSYDPLHDDEQAMALVKKFGLCIHYGGVVPGRGGSKPGPELWEVGRMHNPMYRSRASTILNRAIVECVAKMQAVVPSQAAASSQTTPQDR